MLVEAYVGIQPRHAHVDERLAEAVVGIGAPKAADVPDPVVELDDVDMMVRPGSTAHRRPRFLVCYLRLSKPQMKSSTTAPTTEAMKPAPCHAWYQPMAWPR